MAGLYFHIPFCKRICAYCDFFHSADVRRWREVADAMHRELDARYGLLSGDQVRTIYFGGGTPSLLPPETLQELIDHAGQLLRIDSLEECTAEANPDDLTSDYLAALSRTRIDRLSIGIQSLDDRALKLLNRRHTARAAMEAVRRAQDAGLANITVDLIFGIPGFGGDSLRRTLDNVLEMGVQHVSAYHLTVEPATALGRRAARGEFRPVDELTSESEFLAVHRTLTDAGYSHYEVSNYALPGYRARHNSSYWDGTEYLGIGPSAHSYGSGVRCWSECSIDQYLASAGRDELYRSERLTLRDRYNEYVMTRLRTDEGIALERIEALFGRERAQNLLDQARPMLAAGNLCRTPDGRLAIPPERMLRSDAVIEQFFDV